MLSSPIRAIKCDWIEVYIPHSATLGRYCIEHFDNATFWKDECGDLVIDPGESKNPVVYHSYTKYVTHNAKYHINHFEPECGH